MKEKGINCFKFFKCIEIEFMDGSVESHKGDEVYFAEIQGSVLEVTSNKHPNGDPIKRNFYVLSNIKSIKTVSYQEF